MLEFDNHLGDIIDQCIDKTKKKGATDVEVVVLKNISESVSFRNKKLDEAERSENIGLSLTAFVNKKKNFCFIFKLKR